MVRITLWPPVRARGRGGRQGRTPAARTQGSLLTRGNQVAIIIVVVRLFEDRFSNPVQILYLAVFNLRIPHTGFFRH